MFGISTHHQWYALVGNYIDVYIYFIGAEWYGKAQEGIIII